jgi:F420-dependent oxidoreductase-like protein
MRIGLNGSSLIATGASVAEIRDHAAQAEAEGFSSYWLAQLAVPDALTAIATMGEATSTIEIGTAVVPTWLRHPLMLAAQAMTTQQVIGPRLILGIGLAHKPMIEETLGVPFRSPAKHMEEYVEILTAAWTEGKVDVTGTHWSAHMDSGAAPAGPPPTLMLAAMGPRMLKLAGSQTAGTILWLSGPKAIAEQIKPALDAAAAEAGREMPRIVGSVPICVTSDVDGMKNLIAGVLAGYNDLPSYRGVMDTEGAGGPADVSIVGNEDEVRAGIKAFADAGCTDFTPVELALEPDAIKRTRDLLVDIIGNGV